MIEYNSDCGVHGTVWAVVFSVAVLCAMRDRAYGEPVVEGIAAPATTQPTTEPDAILLKDKELLLNLCEIEAREAITIYTDGRFAIQDKDRNYFGKLGNEQIAKVREAVAAFVREDFPFFSGIRNGLLPVDMLIAGQSDGQRKVSALQGLQLPPKLQNLVKLVARSCAESLDRQPAAREAAGRIANEMIELHRVGWEGITDQEMRRQLVERKKASVFVRDQDSSKLLEAIIDEKDVGYAQKFTLLCILPWREPKFDGKFFLEWTRQKVGPATQLYLDMLQLAMYLGCAEAYGELRKITAERFDEESLRLIALNALSFIAPEGIKTILAAVGEKALREDNALKVWDWVAAHPERLRYTRTSEGDWCAIAGGIYLVHGGGDSDDSSRVGKKGHY